MIPTLPDAYNLFHEASLALADVEDTGIRVDVPYYRQQDADLTARIDAIDKRLWRTKEARQWKAHFKDRTNLDAPAQLSTMLFNVWNYRPTKVTRGGKESVDDEALRKIGTAFTLDILAKRKLLKVRDTYIAQFLRYQVDGLLHPSFNLNLVVTYRSSSDSPNFQNTPVRDPEQGRITRTGFIPHRPPDIFGEIDFKGMEVTTSACYHKDRNMLAYLRDKSSDMHRDMACKCFILTPQELTKMARYVGKNGFTFPEFYGSYFEQIAPAMWEAIGEHKLATVSGVPLYEHLRSKGIKELGSMITNKKGQRVVSSDDCFLAHIQRVERWFWDEQFAEYAQWKKDWYDEYLRTGYFDLLTGFRCKGPMRRNEVCNYPVQGAAFHCMLWTLVQVHRWLKINEMQTVVVGQIHDSIVLNFHSDEVETVLKKIHHVATVDLPNHWKWIIAPMEIEAELAPPGKSWNEKKRVEIPT